MSLKPIIIHSLPAGPNPWKTEIILKELEIPYERKVIKEYSAIKNPEYTALNPNGRAPIIEDPNTNMTVWESNAINEYLVEKYDTGNKISYTSDPEKTALKVWSYFQASGQGPYFGQAAWFSWFHSEKLPSAIERYQKEIVRVAGVLNDQLAKNKTGWLVGDKCTYVDLQFVFWNINGLRLVTEEPVKEFSHFLEWHKKLLERPSVKSSVEEREALMSPH